MPLKHIFEHSAHYGCGDMLSASAETAYSIMADHLRNVGRAAHWYGRFCRERIAALNPRIRWEITSEEIETWLAAKRTALREGRSLVEAKGE